MRWLWLIAAAATLGGCSDGVVGDWRGLKPTIDSFNEMSLEEDGNGTAKVFIYRTVMGIATADPFVFDVEWSERETMFDCDFACTTSPFGECAEDDSLDLNCELDEDDDTRLVCRGDGRWEDYDFTWKRIEE